MGKKRTKTVSELIFDALCELVIDEKREFSRLSVQDIVDKAGVCRNSFYRNFDSIDDILTKQLERVWFSADGNDPDIPYGGVERLMYYCFRIVQLNERFFKVFYLSDPRHYFDYLTQLVISSNAQTARSPIDANEYYRYACRAWIAVGILTEWLFRGFDLPIEEMIKSLMNVYKD